MRKLPQFHMRPLPRALLCLGLLLGGCQTTPPQPQTTGLLQDYQAGRYNQVYQQADTMTRTGSGATRDEARYFAGMSAYRIGDEQQALHHLLPLTKSGDAALAGPANATVGLIYAQMEEHRRALPYLQKATRQISGPEAAQAYFYLGSVEQKLGRWSQARSHLNQALTLNTDPAFRSRIEQQLNTTGFTVQVGAFSDRGNALRQADTLRSRTIPAGLGTPSLVYNQTGSGRSLYLVQAGRFDTYADALAALRRLGLTHALVAPITTGTR